MADHKLLRHCLRQAGIVCNIHWTDNLQDFTTEVSTKVFDAVIADYHLDDGTGIAPAVREQVFERFYRHAGSQANGSGLGLSIAREIVRSHGGRIAIDDGPANGEGGRGTCVRVRLPVHANMRAQKTAGR